MGCKLNIHSSWVAPPDLYDQAWLYGEGTELPVKMEYDTTLAEQAYRLAERWDASRNVSDVSELDFKGGDLDGFDSNQISM